MSGGGPRPEAEPAFVMILLLIMFGLFLWAIWWFFRIPLLEMLRYFRLAELGILDLFTDQRACFNWLRVAPTGNAIPPENVVGLAITCFGANIATMPPDKALEYYNLSGYSINAIGYRVGYYLHWPLAALFIGLGYYAIFVSPRNKFKTKHTLESFIKIQAKMWPVIAPIVNFKPAEYSARVPGQAVPDKLPPMAEALSPEEWIAWHRIPVTNGIPDREATRRALIQQLGPRWQGSIESQSAYFRALFAAYSLKGVQRREEGDDLLGQISTCWSLKGGFQLTSELAGQVNRLLRDPKVGGEGVKTSNKHAYRTTAMLGVLKWSRNMGGVLAPGQFLWLRAAERGLWYPLNNLGRRSFHTEGSGAMAHFMAEESAQKALPIPRVDTAIVALNQFLADPDKRPMPIPEREEPGAKN